MSAADLAPEHPNLRQAPGRLRRSMRIWAALAAGMGVLTASPAIDAALVPALGWLAAAALMVLYVQPALLAVQIGLVHASLGVGLGTRSAFSPADRRGAALLGVAVATAPFVLALAGGAAQPD